MSIVITEVVTLIQARWRGANPKDEQCSSGAL